MLNGEIELLKYIKSKINTLNALFLYGSIQIEAGNALRVLILAYCLFLTSATDPKGRFNVPLGSERVLCYPAAVICRRVKKQYVRQAVVVVNLILSRIVLNVAFLG